MAEHNVLNHIGLIPDGARRWARENDVSYFDSYVYALNKVVDVMNTVFDQGVTIQSIYFLSKENLNRSASDLKAVFLAEIQFFRDTLPELCVRWDCKVVHAGVRNILPSDFIDAIDFVCKSTENYATESGRRLYLLAGYNPWDEINLAISSAPNLAELRQHMWVTEDVDLVIRTGFGTLLSNFLPLQAGYAEIVVLQKYFNDVNVSDITSIIDNFSQGKKRLLGK